MAFQLTPEGLVADYEAYKLRDVAAGSRGQAWANHVTALTHECEAYGILNRTVPPRDRRQMDGGLALIFSEGNDQARIVKRDLLDAGYELQGEEAQASWPIYQIVGHKDFALRKGHSELVRCELKSCNPFTYQKLNSVADVRGHKLMYLRKWDKQVCLYMVLQNVDRYFLILKNKTSGKLKAIEYHLGDEELQVAESLIRKAERINGFLARHEQEVPDGLKLSDLRVCSECEFLAACNPPLTFGPGALFLSDERADELDEMAKRHAELEPGWGEYEELDARIKGDLKQIAGPEREIVTFGEWVASFRRPEVRGKQQTRITWERMPAPIAVK